MNSEKTLLIVGSNGFIGRNAVEYYRARGYRVLEPKRQELNLVDTQAVTTYLAEHRPDLLLMSAVNINSLHDNLQIYFNLARNHGHFGRMITIGSGAEYDRSHYQPMMSEAYFGRHTPADTYGLSKFVIGHDAEQSPGKIYNLRVFGIFGKYEDYTRRFISNNICRAIAGLGISLNRDMRFDFVHVEDFLATAERVFTGTPAQRNYNVCSSRPIELRELAHMVRDRHDPGATVTVRQEGHNGEYSGDNARFVEEFGAIELSDMRTRINELYDWYAGHPDIDGMCRRLTEMDAAA